MNSITSNSSSLPLFSEKRMSSLEIAQVTDKNHQHVMRDIRELIEKEAIAASSFGLSSYLSEQNKEVPMFELDFQASMVLITGYDPKRRAFVIKRWMDLETGAVAPLGVVGDMVSVNKDYFETVLKNTNLLEKNNSLLERLLEEAENKPPRRINFTPVEDALVLKLRDQGLSHREIGLEIGRKPKSISSCLRRLKGATNE